jgi:3-deoxy-D-arabino-heptulosonate 7-phosphate (DAHP) synthase class II
MQVPVLSVRLGRFDSRLAEPRSPPIFTPSGIVLLYSGADLVGGFDDKNRVASGSRDCAGRAGPAFVISFSRAL